MVLSSTCCPTRASKARQISSVVASSPISARSKNGARNARSSSRRRLPTASASPACCLHRHYPLPVVAGNDRVHGRFRDPTVPGDVLCLTWFHQRVIDDQPSLSIQGTWIAAHSLLHFFHRQMRCCSRDPCHVISFSL